MASKDNPPPIPDRRSREADSFNMNEEDRSALQTSVVEGVAVDLATVLAQTLQNMLKNSAAEVRSPLQTFAGLDQEDPHVFLNRLGEYFVKNNVTEDGERLTIATKQLRGEAAKWFAPYQAYPIRYTEFRNKLLNKYNSASVLANIKAKLYGERQRDDEPVSIFIMRKRALLCRICPGMEEEDMIRDIVILIRPKIRAYIRTYNFTSMEEFSRLAEEIEEDIGGPEPSQRAAQPPKAHNNINRAGYNAVAPPTHRQESRPTNPPPRTRETTTVPQQTSSNAERRTPPTPCRHCGEWHYHAACPRNPYRPPGNANGVGGQTTTSTAVTRGPAVRPTHNN